MGVYTLNLSKLVGTQGHVYSIEPSPSNFVKLDKNIAINQLDNCTPYNIALSQKEGRFTFSTSPDCNSGWGRLGEWGAQPKVLVNVETLDGFVKKNEISKIDFLKIDIEGHELDFLRGAVKSLKNRIINTMMIEYCGFSLEPKGITLRDYVHEFVSLGYVARYFHLDKIKMANNGTYKSRGEILNLFFEKKV